MYSNSKKAYTLEDIPYLAKHNKFTIIKKLLSNNDSMLCELCNGIGHVPIKDLSVEDDDVNTYCEDDIIFQLQNSNITTTCERCNGLGYYTVSEI